MLLEPGTLELAPLGSDVIAALEATRASSSSCRPRSSRSSRRPRATCPPRSRELAGARRDLAARAEGIARPAGAAVHPFSATEGELNDDERYGAPRASSAATPTGSSSARFRSTWRSATPTAPSPCTTRCAPTCPSSRRSPRPPRSTAAGTPASRPSGPRSRELLPRQGVPPPLGSWEDLAAAFDWGAASGAVPEPARLVVGAAPAPELRHARAARARHAGDGRRRRRGRRAGRIPLIGWLAERHDGGRAARPRPQLAHRGEPLVGLPVRRGGHARRPARRASGCRRAPRLRALIDAVAPTAARLGCAGELEHARGAGGAQRRHAQRARRRPTAASRRWPPGSRTVSLNTFE